MADRGPPKRRDWSWRSQAFRGLVYQLIAVGAVALGVWYLAQNTLANMAARGIQSGFDFLRTPAGFDIGESLIPYDALDPYWVAFGVGVLNTLRVAVIGIVLATILGTLLGVGRFSRNAILRGLCYAYVEFFRNVPVLLQLLMWYLILTDVLPPLSEAISIAGVLFLSNNGFKFPVPVWGLGQALAGVGGVLGIVLAWAYRRWAMRQFELTGRVRSLVLVPIGIVIAAATAGWIAGGAPTAWSIPRIDGFLTTGGATATPEFLAVLLGLVLYTSAFIAEVVRAGINSVSHGQVEAASSLGLTKGQSMRLVILPQALRVIIPPMTSQYLNLTKNSSLAVAIGYPDVVSIANTSLNQTGRAVECIAIIMAVYLTTSLSTAAFMNWYNKRAAIKER
ncbi:ABC transporter permease subunit [Betaproteobacteria bacterium PRO7]|jgi:general L-amino acid transport system permease protein|nr:ABC transporter permease subunit [Burkholderiaceae bacterium]MDL1861752.1 ABC transporter permease subunit [Betaproteobacteria bacterium PRO7]